ncbi:MAG TPA: ATP-binding protein [Magnetospirillum sp.]|nr:ATP-binding protein [Magnetospirillum sp.]
MNIGLGAYRHLALLWGFILSFDAYVLGDLWASRAEAERQAVQLATSYVRLVEEHATGSFDRANLTLRQVAALVPAHELRTGLRLDARRVAALQTAMRELQGDGRGIVSITLTAADGRIVANSLGAPLGNSLGDRDYFLTLRDSGTDGPVVSKLVLGRVSNKWGIQISRALKLDGAFAGMVVANLGLSEYMAPFYESLLLPPNSAVTLRDLNHRVIVRYPVAEETISMPLPSPAVDQAFANGLSEGNFHRDSPIDGIARSVAFRKLADTPIYATVALADHAVLATWRGIFRRSIAFIVLITLGGLLSTVILRRKERLERQVRENADKLSVALRAAHAVTWHWDASSDRLDWTGDVRALYAGQVPPKTLSDWLMMLSSEDRGSVVAEIERVLCSRSREYRIEYRIDDGHGGLRWLTGIGMVSYGPEDTLLGAFGVNIDISAVKGAEAQLKAARDEALEAKAEAERASVARSKFLAAASHDLRQPVQSLLLLIEVMKIRLAGTPMEQVTAQMENALDGLRLLLNSLLDMSKLDAGVVVPTEEDVDLGQLLGRLSQEYGLRAAEKGLRLRVVPTRLHVVSDATLLERVLRNLIENAIRYTPVGRILLGCRRSGAGVDIMVADTGIGIAPEHQEVVFEEFHQVANSARDRSQGLGLGLAIVRRLVGLLGGRIRLASVLGKGCRFTVSLPLSPK